MNCEGIRERVGRREGGWREIEREGVHEREKEGTGERERDISLWLSVLPPPTTTSPHRAQLCSGIHDKVPAVK